MRPFFKELLFLITLTGHIDFSNLNISTGAQMELTHLHSWDWLLTVKVINSAKYLKLFNLWGKFFLKKNKSGTKKRNILISFDYEDSDLRAHYEAGNVLLVYPRLIPTSNYYSETFVLLSNVIGNGIKRLSSQY